MYSWASKPPNFCFKVQGLVASVTDAYATEHQRTCWCRIENGKMMTWLPWQCTHSIISSWPIHMACAEIYWPKTKSCQNPDHLWNGLNEIFLWTRWLRPNKDKRWPPHSTAANGRVTHSLVIQLNHSSFKHQLPMPYLKLREKNKEITNFHLSHCYN